MPNFTIVLTVTIPVEAADLEAAETLRDEYAEQVAEAVPSTGDMETEIIRFGVHHEEGFA